MFEITGSDISNLGDADLRSLITHLAVAELKAKGYPRSSVTAGGNQDAADGGLDVRVECPSEITNPDFVPRRLTGFQVKKPDMPRSAILEEMRPKGVLRNVIRELADASGSYVIVSSHGSVADKALADRRKAMRDALTDVPSAARLHTDFYDRERLATWTNEYPGVAAWVRGRVGRPLSGWSGIGGWEGSGVRDPKPYLSNDKACLIDERSRDREKLTIAEGIARLRDGLSTPKRCIRLVGLSGLGKTRLVQALFEQGVGENPLDPSLAVYTDYSEETAPTARDMARELIASGQRAILIVDNCNPTTHSELARLCSSDASKVSLITVEYDVRDDEPEHTDVFRLQSASPELVSEWIKQGFPDISQVDREKIAEFSDGNFRVARALAETLGKGETFGSLRSRELFERIFFQRNEPDRQLLQSAEELALLYSVDGEDMSDEGELARFGAIRGTGAAQYYEALAALHKRGVSQARGRFRAILPQAIANPLAAHALDRIPPTNFDEFCRTLTPRMLKSVSRRLGNLHDSATAQAAVMRWLRKDGPLGDLIARGEEGIQIITHVAPVTPKAVLAKIEQELDGPLASLILAPTATGRHQWIRLIKAISYDADLFDTGVALLSRFLTAEPEGRPSQSAHESFSDLFHIYLSGTQATPHQRRAAISRLAAADDASLGRCANIALRALLKSDHFVSTASHDFGARSRDWGWHPRFQKDIWEWFEEAIALTVKLMPEAEARAVLASGLRSLWRYPGCREALNRAAVTFIQRQPWIEGWIACRVTLRFDGKDMPKDIQAMLEQLTKRLKPPDLLNQARAVVLNRMPGGGWDFADGEDDEGNASKSWEKADSMAREVGCALATDTETRAEFIAELLRAHQAQRAFQCGQGLAEGRADLNEMWLELLAAYGAAGSGPRNPTVLGGFIAGAHQRDPNFCSCALDAALGNSELLPILPYFQGCVRIDAEGIARLRRAIATGGLLAESFNVIANGSVAESPPEPLAELLEDISTVPHGVEVALGILNMHFYRDLRDRREHNARLVSVGRALLARADFSEDSPLQDYGAHEVIRICLPGEDGGGTAERLCANIRSAFDGYRVSSHNLRYTLKALFEVQPLVALDAFLLSDVTEDNSAIFDAGLGMEYPIETLNPSILKDWAGREPNTRYELLGKCLSMFTKEDGGQKERISDIFVSMLEQAPNKRLFLGDPWKRLHPGGWTGSLADILHGRKAQVLELAGQVDEGVRAWVNDAISRVDGWIERDRLLDRDREERFE